MSSQQVGELYYKVGVKGLQEALKDLDKLYEKSGKGPSSSSPFNVGPIDKSGATIKSVAEARKHLQELAQGIGVDLNKVVSQIGKMPDLLIKQAHAKGMNPLASYNEGMQRVLVRPGVTPHQSLKHELMHAIESLVPKDVFNSIVRGFGPARLSEVMQHGGGSEYTLNRMRPHEVFASFMERQSPDVIRALIGSDMTTKVAALAGDAAARAVVRATTVNRTAPVTLAGGFGEGVSVDSRYGRGSRVVSATTTLPASSLSRQGRPDPNDFGATVNAPSSGDDFGAGVLTPAQKAKATAAANAANARASQVQANIAAFMGSNHGGFAGGGGFGGGGGSGGGMPPNVPPANPWLPTISTMTRDEHNNLVARAASATSLANEITGQIRGSGPGGINERLDNARMNVLQEEAVPGSTGSTITARQNELLDLEEQRLHVAGRYADIEQAVNNTLGTQVSYANKIVEAEEAALKYAKQRNELPLSAAQEAAIKKSARSAEEANLIGGVGGSAQKNLEDAKTRLKNLQDARAGATAENTPLIDKAIRETRSLIDLEARRLRMAQELAAVENRLATDPSLSRGDRNRLEKSAAHYREELKAANIESENSGRSMAKDKSKLSNYRLQELSYGVQDFAQVLSGGGGLDAALRAANNNISQFYAAAGGANAARNSMVATMAVLGIAAAMKFLADQADLPIKRLEEFNEKLKKLQGTNTEIARIMGSGTTRLGDISGESGISSGSAMADMGLALRNKRDLLGNEVDIFGGRQKVGALEQMGGVFRTVVAENLDFIGSAAGLFSGAAGDYFKKGADEYRNTVAGSVLGQAFNDRFVDKKSASEISLPAVMTGQQKKYFSAILGSKDTSTESAIKAFKEIDEGGGWRGVPKEEIEPFRESVRLLDEQIKKIAAAAKSFEFSLSAMGDNLRQRNSLLANAGSQRRLAASTEDVRFINEQNAMATQLERDAKALREEGLVKEAERAEKEAESRRRVAAVRAGNMAPGGGAMLTSQAAAFEDVLSPFAEARAAAQKMLAEAQNPTGRAGALTQLHNIGLNEADTLRKQSMGFAFSGQQANESFTEADQRLSETYKQMAKSIAGRARDNGDAADEAKAKLDSAIAREKAMLEASRKFESSSRSARAFGTRFDEQRAALEKSNAEEVARIKRDFGGKGQEADLKRELGLAEEGRKRQSREIAKQKERATQEAETMFAGQAAGLIGGRPGQHYANAQQLESNLRSIQDARDAKLLTEEEAAKKRREAQSIFEEQKKQIEQKQVGFSDIGGMWKQIQMSLKPDKSIEMQKIANDHLRKIADMVGAAGLKVEIPLGA